jgi:hypothetical protein
MFYFSVDCMYSKITGDHGCVQRYHTDKENKSTIMTSGTLTYTSNAWAYNGHHDHEFDSIHGNVNSIQPNEKQ